MPAGALPLDIQCLSLWSGKDRVKIACPRGQVKTKVFLSLWLGEGCQPFILLQYKGSFCAATGFHLNFSLHVQDAQH